MESVVRHHTLRFTLGITFQIDVLTYCDQITRNDRGRIMKTCWYKAIEGVSPEQENCDRLHPNGCNDCLYYLPDPPEINGDELPPFPAQ